MPNTGPRLGSRRQSMVFLPRAFSASARPQLMVVLPSPAGVGLMAVTKISLPCFWAFLASRWSIFALYLP